MTDGFDSKNRRPTHQKIEDNGKTIPFIDEETFHQDADQAKGIFNAKESPAEGTI